MSSDWLIRRNFTGIFLCFCHLWILHVFKVVLQLVFCGLYCLYFIVSQLWSNISAVPLTMLFLSFSSAQVCSEHLLLFLCWAETITFLILPESASDCKTGLKRKWFRNCFVLFTTSQGDSQHTGRANVYMPHMLRTQALECLSPRVSLCKFTICPLFHVYLVIVIWICPILIPI